MPELPNQRGLVLARLLKGKVERDTQASLNVPRVQLADRVRAGVRAGPACREGPRASAVADLG